MSAQSLVGRVVALESVGHDPWLVVSREYKKSYKVQWLEPVSHDRISWRLSVVNSVPPQVSKSAFVCVVHTLTADPDDQTVTGTVSSQSWAKVVSQSWA